MAKYLVASSHTPQECLQTLDTVLAEGKDVLNKYEWGCAVGEHTGYAMVDARDKDEAQKIVPTSLRSKARVVELTKFTPEQIRSLHEK